MHRVSERGHALCIGVFSFANDGRNLASLTEIEGGTDASQTHSYFNRSDFYRVRQLSTQSDFVGRRR